MNLADLNKVALAMVTPGKGIRNLKIGREWPGISPRP